MHKNAFSNTERCLLCLITLTSGKFGDILEEGPLLLLVNGRSGKGKGEEYVSNLVGPLFTFSGLTFDIVKTG